MGRTRYLGVSSSSSGRAIASSWAAVPRVSDASAHQLFVSRVNADASGLAIANYSVDVDFLQGEVSVLRTGDEAPENIAVHPCGDIILCSFSSGCRLVEVRDGELNFLDTDPLALHLIGAQNKLAFSVDGSRFACGGKDGHLRVFDWPSMNILIDEAKAHKSIKDLDFSLDGALLASTSDDGPCRIWELEKAVPLTSLHREKSERFGHCRFSRNGTQPFLFVIANKDRKGYIAVWEIVNWRRLGSKRFLEEEISAFTTSCDGKRLAIGGAHGDVAVIEVKKMEKRQQVKNAHLSAVSFVELSPNSRALLSLSTDGNVRVTATYVPAPWKDWQVYFLLIGLIVMSALLFYVFFEYSDSFWSFPLGRNQPGGSPLRAIYGDPAGEDPSGVW